MQKIQKNLMNNLRNKKDFVSTKLIKIDKFNLYEKKIGKFSFK